MGPAFFLPGIFPRDPLLPQMGPAAIGVFSLNMHNLPHARGCSGPEDQGWLELSSATEHFRANARM